MFESLYSPWHSSDRDQDDHRVMTVTTQSRMTHDGGVTVGACIASAERSVLHNK